MADFKIAFNITSKEEGGYVSPEVASSIKDAGGETYKGIARNANPDWSGWRIIDRYKLEKGAPQVLGKVKYHGIKHGAFLKDATLDKMVEERYFNNYWNPLNLSQLTNQSLANFLYDLHVGSSTGLRAAVKYLQKKLGLVQDGVIGPKTIAALNKKMTNSLFEQLKEFRIKWLKRALKGKVYLSNLIGRTNRFFFLPTSEENLQD